MTADGSTLLTFRQRPGAATTLFLFVPGLGGNLVQWEAVQDALARHEVAIASVPAVRPHPALGAAPPLIEDVARAVAGELAGTQYRHVVVLAHSVGSFVGFGLAACDPRVRGVIAVNGALYSVGRFLDQPVTEFIRRPSFGLAALRLSSVAALPTNRRVREFVLRRERLSVLVAGRLVPREVMRSERSRRVLVHGTNQRGIFQGLWANRHHWPRFAASAGNVSCPVVLVTGTLDPLTSVEDSHRMAALFPAGSVQVLDQVGHSAPLQAPGAIVEIAERLAGLVRPAAGGA